MAEWEKNNIVVLMRNAEMLTGITTSGVCNIFRQRVDQTLFNHNLDFAIREWARVLDQTDTARTATFTVPFEQPLLTELFQQRLL